MGGLFVGRGRKARRCYGFDEIALVPGEVTINPEEVNISFSVGKIEVKVPIIASAMDGVVDPDFAVAFSKLGGADRTGRKSKNHDRGFARNYLVT